MTDIVKHSAVAHNHTTFNTHSTAVPPPEQYTAFELWEFIRLVIQGGKKFGMENIKRFVYALTGDYSAKEKELLNFILYAVLSKFKISYKELIDKGKADVSDARRIYVMLLNKHLQLSNSQIAVLVKREPQNVQFLLKQFDEYDEKIPMHQDVLHTFTELDSRINTFKKTLKLKYQEV